MRAVYSNSHTQSPKTSPSRFVFRLCLCTADFVLFILLGHYAHRNMPKALRDWLIKSKTRIDIAVSPKLQAEKKRLRKAMKERRRRAAIKGGRLVERTF